MKKVLIGAAVLAAAVIVAVILLVGNVDRLIKGALEGIGSELLGTKVRVESVRLDLRSGSGRISGFTIANPPGYSSGNAFQMATIMLDLRLGSLGEQPLVIEELNIQDPEVRVEAREDGNTNLQTLLDNIEKNSAEADKKAAERRPEAAGTPEGEPVRIRFERLAITGVKVHASIPTQEPQTVVIPDIVMRNVGQGAGLTPAGIGKVVIGEVIKKSLESVLKKKMTEKVEEAAKGLLEDLRHKISPGKDEQ